MAASARSVLLVGKDPRFIPLGSDFEEHSVIAHAKSNLAPKGTSFSFALKHNEFSWVGPSDVTVEELTNVLWNPATSMRSSQQYPKLFLQDYLANGPKLREVIVIEAKRRGIAERTLERAAQELGVISKPVHGEAGHRSGAMWSLPEEPEAEAA
jgi:hypothetical protein